MANPKSFVLKFANNCQCDGCERTLKKLKKIDEVHSTFYSTKTGELTISGPVDPEKVIRFLEKHGKKAKLVPQEIPPKRNHHNVPIVILPVRPYLVVQESNDQNLVAQVQELAKNVKGFKQLEVTQSKKVTLSGKNKDEVNTESDTQIKIVMGDDNYYRRGTGTSFGGPWQGNYFPLPELQPVASYEPSAPPTSRQVWVMRKV